MGAVNGLRSFTEGMGDTLQALVPNGPHVVFKGGQSGNRGPWGPGYGGKHAAGNGTAATFSITALLQPSISTRRDSCCKAVVLNKTLTLPERDNQHFTVQIPPLLL